MVIGLLILVTSYPAVDELSNARYLGIGYNLITGNPDNNAGDPGFKENVLEFTWANNVRTSDGRYQVPDNVQALQTRSCTLNSEAREEFGSRSYQNSLSVDATVEGRCARLIISGKVNIVNWRRLMGCLHDPANGQQTSSKCFQNTHANAGRLLDRVSNRFVCLFLCAHQ